MPSRRFGLIVLPGLGIQACSQQGAYTGLREGQRNGCQKIPEARRAGAASDKPMSPTTIITADSAKLPDNSRARVGRAGVQTSQAL